MATALHRTDFHYLSEREDPICRNLTHEMCVALNASTETGEEYPSCSWSETGGNDCTGVNLSLLTAYTMWLYCGFLSLGSLAGELENPKQSYIIALMILIPIVLIVNCIPLAVSMSLDHDRNNFVRTTTTTRCCSSCASCSCSSFLVSCCGSSSSCSASCARCASCITSATSNE